MKTQSMFQRWKNDVLMLLLMWHVKERKPGPLRNQVTLLGGGRLRQSMRKEKSSVEYRRALSPVMRSSVLLLLTFSKFCLLVFNVCQTVFDSGENAWGYGFNGNV